MSKPEFSREVRNIKGIQQAHVLAVGKMAGRGGTVSYCLAVEDAPLWWTRCVDACLKCQAREFELLKQTDWELPFEMPKILELAESATPSET